MTDLRDALGARRLREIVAEQTLPVVAAAATWWIARVLLLMPSASRSMGSVELAMILGAVVAATSWLTARQLTVLNYRRPVTHLVWGLVAAASAIGVLAWSVRSGFNAACLVLGGDVIDAAGLVLASGAIQEVLVCQLHAVPDNVYLPGTLLRASWDGIPEPALVAILMVISVFASVGTRNLRLAPSRLGFAMMDVLRQAPAAGWKSVYEGSAATAVQACGNPTLWGEPCGQLYPHDKVFEPGEWCIRCSQVYRRSERTLTFQVVSLFTGDIDVLNGLERLDGTSWPSDSPQPPDARLSGQERWVRLGEIEVPEVVSVSTMLQLVAGQFKKWSAEAPAELKPAFALAEVRASRLSAWIWLGFEDHALTYARPTDRAVLAVGPTRLRDLPIETGERLALQLDIGLLPLELRTGFRQTFLDPAREPLVQNLKQDLWVPVAPPQGVPGGLWVPRIEGRALRTWLSMDRLRADTARGVVSPRPYAFPGDPVAHGHVAEGTLDLHRMPLENGVPLRTREAGLSIAEWEWFDEALIELLRQQALVLVTA